MTTSPIDAALRKILSARARGSLPADLIFSANGTSIDLELPARSLNFDALYEWAKKNFPGGVLVDQRTLFRGTGARRRVYDRYTYRATLNGGQSFAPYVNVSVRIPHAHSDYQASTKVKDSRTGLPKWICLGCQKPIALTEARRLGLLPEKGARK